MESTGFRNSGAVEEIGSSIQYDYAKDDFIGRGAFGIVYKAKVRKALLRFRTPSEPDFVAVKVMHVAINSGIAADQENWMTAVKRMRQLPGLKHKHIVRYHKVSITQTSGGVTVKLAMDYHKGDLASFLREAKENTTLLNNWRKVIPFAEDLAQGLQFLHQNGIIHGDLKPENILLSVSQNGSEKLVIGDLDDLVQMKESATCSADISQLRGTLRYMSPEMLRKFSQQEAERPGRKTDIWSLGCIILEMAESYARVPKKQLVKDGNIVDAGSALANYQYASLIIDGYIPSVSDDIEHNLARLIRQCVDASSANRLSAGELLKKCYVMDFFVYD
ncbi:cyclin-dependent kinase 4-like [Paramacrobiotus metropolitanus]|uniref:cyclin-dependent kinase 4-like n=1 Tax=Paramacrobiotus metropolitanus TaxID=2943436 RepID=UPI00244562B4|nr:cyclin-dependent kinase 4-like [Paramacrobiotus metropolitanus]